MASSIMAKYSRGYPYMSLKYFTVEDATYAYTMEGQGETIILLHGFTGTHATWEPYMDQWKQNYQVVAMDMPGHGSTVCQSPRTMKKFCEDFRQLLHHLQCE